MSRCEICEVDLPLGEEAKELHESGKRHIKIRAQKESASTLQDISIFARWKPASIRINSTDLQAVFEKFGPVERLLFREEGSFAIVEFKDKLSAEQALAAGRFQINEVSFMIEKRKIQFSDQKVHKTHLNVDQIVKDFRNTNLISITMQADELINTMIISEEEVTRRMNILKLLEGKLSKYFVDPKIEMFGSCITGIGTVDSDIDATLFVGKLPFPCPELNRDKYTLLTCDPRILAGRKISADELLRLSPADRVRFVCKVINEVRKDCGWIGLQRPVLDARCPVVRFIANRELLIDLSVNNSLGLAKSQFLKDIIQNERSGNFRRILVTFRFWALSKGLFDTPAHQHAGHFNAYILNLLVFYFLIHTKKIDPSVIGHGISEAFADSWRVDFNIKPWSLEHIDLVTFFKEFFVYVVETPLGDYVFGRSDEIVTDKHSFRERIITDPQMQPFKFGFLNIQDPLELSHNVAQNVSEKFVGLMKKNMMYSLSVIKKKHKKIVLADMFCLFESPESRPTSVIPTTDLTYQFPTVENPSIDGLKHILYNVFEVLALKPLFDGSSDVKRMRLDETIWESPSYSITSPSWIGRRDIKRQIQRTQNISGMELEKKTTDAMNFENRDSIAKVIFIIDLREDNTAFMGLRRLEGSPQQTKDMWHFLTTLISNNWAELVKNW